jgi:hypothetical protein
MMGYIFWCFCVITICMASCGRNFGERTNVLTPDGAAEFRVMDFSVPPSLDPISPGWAHRTFFWHGPVQIDFVQKEGLPAVKLRTEDTASMLVRHVNIPLRTYPMPALAMVCRTAHRK